MLIFSNFYLKSDNYGPVISSKTGPYYLVKAPVASGLLIKN